MRVITKAGQNADLTIAASMTLLNRSKMDSLIDLELRSKKSGWLWLTADTTHFQHHKAHIISKLLAEGKLLNFAD